MELRLENVTSTFAVGTTVGLYADAVYDGGHPAPVGDQLDSAVVAADGSLSFTAHGGGAVYVVAAKVEDVWRLRRVTTSPSGEMRFVTQEELDAVGRSVTRDGAIGDGVTDDTAAIQAAIDAVEGEGGGIVFFPPGYWRFSEITIPKGVTLAGVGWDCGATQAPFGDATWEDFTRFKGSVLISTATEGAGISVSSPGNTNVFIRDLLILGPGSGDSSGVLLGESVASNKGVIGGEVNNVMVANFATCWDLRFVLDCTFISLRARGCEVGFSLSETTNQNVFVNTEVQFSEVDAILLDESGGNVFYGGLLQNISGTAGVRIATPGELNTFDGFWCEAFAAGVWCFLLEAGSRNRISNTQIATDSEDFAIKIEFAAAATSLDRIHALEPEILIDPEVVGTMLRNVNISPNFTDGGAQTVYETFTPRCRVFHQGFLEPLDATPTLVPFAGERYDYGGMHDKVVENTKVVAPIDGTYNISAAIGWDANDVGLRQVDILVNGTVIARDFVPATSGGGVGIGQTVSTDYELAAGDYVQVQVLQTSGGKLKMAGFGAYAGELMAHRVGP